MPGSRKRAREENSPPPANNANDGSSSTDPSNNAEVNAETSPEGEEITLVLDIAGLVITSERPDGTVSQDIDMAAALHRLAQSGGADALIEAGLESEVERRLQEGENYSIEPTSNDELESEIRRRVQERRGNQGHGR